MDKSCSDPQLEPDSDEPNRMLRSMHARLCAIGRDFASRRVLVVAQQAVEAALLRMGWLPPNLQLAHHNNIAGRDEWRDVAAVVVVGRTAPKPEHVSAMAGAMTGGRVEAPADWYEQAETWRERAGSAMQPATVDFHPHPIAEAIRFQTCEAELIQIIGRACSATIRISCERRSGW